MCDENRRGAAVQRLVSGCQCNISRSERSCGCGDRESVRESVRERSCDSCVEKNAARSVERSCNTCGGGGRNARRNREGSCSCREESDFNETYPLAMSYVPWQTLCTTTCCERSIQEGTIFPELVKPFMEGGCRNG